MKLAVAHGQALDGILSESYAIWSDGLTKTGYARYNQAQLRTRWGGRHLQRVVLVDDHDTVLSSAKRYDLEATLDGQPLRIVGIGAVFTPESRRGRGYARRIIEEILADARQRGAGLALLFSEIDPEYYAALGFMPVARHELLVRICETPGAPAVLVRAGEDRDIPAVVALARTMIGTQRFALVPSEDSLRFSLAKKRLLAGLLEPDLLNVEFFVVEEGISAAAFVISTVTRDDAILEMCGDRDPSGARVGAMLQVLRARTPVEPAPTYACSLPWGWMPPQVKIESRQPIREVMMVRPLKPGVLTRPLREEDVLFWHGDRF